LGKPTHTYFLLLLLLRSYSESDNSREGRVNAFLPKKTWRSQPRPLALFHSLACHFLSYLKVLDPDFKLPLDFATVPGKNRAIHTQREAKRPSLCPPSFSFSLFLPHPHLSLRPSRPYITPPTSPVPHSIASLFSSLSPPLFTSTPSYKLPNPPIKSLTKRLSLSPSPHPAP